MFNHAFGCGVDVRQGRALFISTISSGCDTDERSVAGSAVPAVSLASTIRARDNPFDNLPQTFRHMLSGLLNAAAGLSGPA